MQHQIICHSPKGYADAFAEEFRRFLPEDTLQMRTDAAPAAPVQIVYFETGRVGYPNREDLDAGSRFAQHVLRVL